MPLIRQEPPASSVLPTDAFVIDRLGVGTMYVQQNAGGPMIPYAAQMTLTSFQYTWVGQIIAATFWPKWDSLVTNSAPTPAFNPDGMASLTTPVISGAAPPGPVWPGFTIPVAGIYHVYAYINMVSLSASVISPAIFDTFIEQVPVLFPTGATTLVSDSSFSSFSTTSGNQFASCNVQGSMNCLAGDTIFVGINDANGFGANHNVAITNSSYFGIYRVR